MTKEIQLANGKVCLVDDGDYKMLSMYGWYAKENSNTTYVYTQLHKNKTRRTVHIHQMLLLPPDGYVVDHINGNGLDNRRSNLRLCTQSQNRMNSKKSNRNNAGIKGVGWSKDNNKWYAYITFEKVMRNLGHYINKDEAINARKQAEEKYYKEYAKK